MIKFDLRLRKAPAFIGRFRTADIAFAFRMPGGFAGAVNRTHPANIVPYLNNVTSPVQLFGQGVQIGADNASVRGITTADNAGAAGIFGIAVRTFPFQQGQAATDFAPAAIGTAKPLGGVIDILKSGFIMVQVNGATVLGGPAYVWSAASAGAHVQGNFEAAAPGGSGVALTGNTYYNGVPDANGIVELAFNL